MSSVAENAYIIDSAGNKYELVMFFDHDEQKWLYALEYVETQEQS